MAPRAGVRKHWAELLVEEIRQAADKVRTFGDPRSADVMDKHAALIEQRRQAWDDAELTNAEGAIESGFTPDRLRQLRKDGKWSGKRKDLPRHPTGGGTPGAPPALSVSSASSTPASGTKGVSSIAERRLSRQTGAPLDSRSMHV